MHTQEKSLERGDDQVLPQEEHSSIVLKQDVRHYVNWGMHGRM